MGVYITLQGFALGLQTVGLELRELRAARGVVVAATLRVPSRTFELPLQRVDLAVARPAAREIGFELGVRVEGGENLKMFLQEREKPRED